ncbi:hypothetical protein ACJJTC_003053 [Scirpophaga incertulas]
MNAVIGLCHFCEAHGPRPLFCTFTTDDEDQTKDSIKPAVECTGCTSLGPETIIITKDEDGTIFCSRETVVNEDVRSFLRQAAIRSITCEVSWSKDGGVVYFSDTQGHVLSLNFQIKDTRARGLKRWFSIVVLMKDKMLLLNIMPVLSEHMQIIAKELQQSAEIVFDNEQKICTQRALRLKTGRNDFGQSRSLLQLTGDKDVFKKLHSHFSWMLKVGAHTYSESLHTSHVMLQKTCPNYVKNSIFNNSICNVPDNEECLPIRELETILSKTVFRIILYCTLTGVKVVIKSSLPQSENLVKALVRLTPTNIFCPNVTICNNNEVYKPSESICVLEDINKKYICNYILPSKCPTLMRGIENSISNDKFNNAVLHHHIKSMMLEWHGKATAVKSAIKSSGRDAQAVVNLKQILGISAQDEQLIDFWINAYCS